MYDNQNELNETKEQIIELINKINDIRLLKFIYDFVVIAIKRYS